MISYNAEEVKMPKLERRRLNRWIRAVAQQYGKVPGEIAYIFCNDAKILEVNRTYLEHDYFTDIITFDYSENQQLNGDVFISLDTVADNAKSYEVSFEDELRRIMIHGILHLTGQDDQTPELRAEMIAKEDAALQLWKTIE